MDNAERGFVAGSMRVTTDREKDDDCVRIESESENTSQRDRGVQVTHSPRVAKSHRR